MINSLKISVQLIVYYFKNDCNLASINLISFKNDSFIKKTTKFQRIVNNIHTITAIKKENRKLIHLITM